MRNGPYELVVCPLDYPGKIYRSRYCYEHHLVWWKYHRIILKKGHEIHHINGNHRDNRIENLMIVSSSEHRKLHGALNSINSQQTVLCGYCNKEFIRLKSRVKSRLKKSKSGRIFCCKSHQALFQFRGGRKDMRCTVNADQAGALPAPGANYS